MISITNINFANFDRIVNYSKKEVPETNNIENKEKNKEEQKELENFEVSFIKKEKVLQKRRVLENFNI